MVQLICTDLSAGHPGRPVLQGLDLQVFAGDFLCVTGENGRGKTTLAKTLLGLLPPLGGSVRLCGGLHRREIGYLPQQTAAQRDFPASVREVVLSGCQGRCGLRPFYNSAEKRLARRAMEQLRVEQLAGRCYRALSGGQQRRVLLARALCAARGLLLLDEPAAGLDPEAAARLYALIGRLNRQQGMTVIMISHDTDAVLRHASRVLHLGEVPFCGSPDAFRQRVGPAIFAGQAEGGEAL